MSTSATIQSRLTDALLAPGALFHAQRTPSSLMRINFASTQEAQFWKTFARLRDEQVRA